MLANIMAGLSATSIRGGRTIDVTVSRGRASRSELAAVTSETAQSVRQAQLKH